MDMKLGYCAQVRLLRCVLDKVYQLLIFFRCIFFFPFLNLLASLLYAIFCDAFWFGSRFVR